MKKTQKQRGPGRPPVDHRKETKMIRVELAQFEQIREAAAHNGRTLTSELSQAIKCYFEKRN